MLDQSHKNHTGTSETELELLNAANALSDDILSMSSIASTAGHESKKPRVLVSGHTCEGRLRLAQDVFARYLKNIGVDQPLIIDVGIGDGAPTIRDFAFALEKVGLESATIVAIDACKWRVLAANALLERLTWPESIKVHFVLGDVTAPIQSDFNIRNVVSRLEFEGHLLRTECDLATSANLLNGLEGNDLQTARESLSSIVKSDGMIGLGKGDGSFTSRNIDLVFDLYRPTSPQAASGRIDFSSNRHFHLLPLSSQESLLSNFAEYVSSIQLTNDSRQPVSERSGWHAKLNL